MALADSTPVTGIRWELFFTTPAKKQHQVPFTRWPDVAVAPHAQIGHQSNRQNLEHHLAQLDSSSELSHRLRRGVEGWVGCERAHSPPFSRRGGCAINKKIPFHCGADGVVSKRSRSLLIYARSAPFLFEFTNHPACAAKEWDLFIEAQPPLLNTEGNELASTAVIEFETACLRQSPEI